jgi:hypothetical protein
MLKQLGTVPQFSQQLVHVNIQYQNSPQHSKHQISQGNADNTYNFHAQNAICIAVLLSVQGIFTAR